MSWAKRATDGDGVRSFIDAGAKRAEVTLAASAQTVTLTIADDGVGFDSGSADPPCAAQLAPGYGKFQKWKSMAGRRATGLKRQNKSVTFWEGKAIALSGPRKTAAAFGSHLRPRH